VLLLLHDDYYSHDPLEYWTLYCWVVVTSKNLPEATLDVTEPKFEKIPENDFAGKSIEEVHEFLLKQHGSRRDIDISWLRAVILDQKGLETNTALIIHRDMVNEESSDYKEGDDIWTNTFKTTRVPFNEVSNVMGNLGLGNMGFEEFIDTRAEPLDDGTWEYHRSGYDDPEELARMRETVHKRLIEMKQLGYVSDDSVPRLREVRL
jgi:hypothetical protein